ncbi:hypothetical protein [Luteibacter sp. dw_328]|uniref:hypothetical protein n=1 Tax=Luteibacter sp. dw_328 TaxID=2719796 RepID=UPI001BD63487|nr:hypothetical protein [Luteibacter sp. dw_328]
MLRDVITSLKFGRVSSLWMKVTGLVPDDGGAIGRRAALSVSNLGLPANDAWLLSLLYWINEQPESEQLIAAHGVGRFLRAHEGRVDLHPSTLQSMRGVVAAWSSPTPVQASTAGPLDVRSIPNLAGRVASVIDDVLNTSRSYGLARGCMRLNKEGAVSFWPEQQSPHGSIVASVNLADIAAVAALNGALMEDRYMRATAVDSIALEVVRRLDNQVRVLGR